MLPITLFNFLPAQPISSSAVANNFQGAHHDLTDVLPLIAAPLPLFPPL